MGIGLAVSEFEVMAHEKLCESLSLTRDWGPSGQRMRKQKKKRIKMVKTSYLRKWKKENS
jgi:hypothetical protein